MTSQDPRPPEAPVPPRPSAPSPAERATQLAADRTALAAERTYAAWMRTGLAALASGVGAKALLAHLLPAWFGAATGTLLILFSAFAFFAAVWRDLSFSPAPPAPGVRRLPPAVLVGVSAYLILVDAAAVAGIWTARA